MQDVPLGGTTVDWKDPSTMRTFQSDYITDWMNDQNDLAQMPAATAKTPQERLHRPVSDVLFLLKGAEGEQRISAEEKKVFRDEGVKEILIALNDRKMLNECKAGGIELSSACRNIYNKLNSREQRTGHAYE